MNILYTFLIFLHALRLAVSGSDAVSGVGPTATDADQGSRDHSLKRREVQPPQPPPQPPPPSGDTLYTIFEAASWTQEGREFMHIAELLSLNVGRCLCLKALEPIYGLPITPPATDADADAAHAEMARRYYLADSIANKRECIVEVSRRLQALRQAEQAEYPETVVVKPSSKIGREYNTLFNFHVKIGEVQGRCMCLKGGATGLGVAALDGRFRDECFQESFKAVVTRAGENIATVAIWAMPRPVRPGEDDCAAASALFRTPSVGGRAGGRLLGAASRQRPSFSSLMRAAGTNLQQQRTALQHLSDNARRGVAELPAYVKREGSRAFAQHGNPSDAFATLLGQRGRGGAAPAAPVRVGKF